MNTKRKGDAFVLELKRSAEARGLPVVKVRSSGHMGDRGGIPADIVIGDWRIECKRYRRGIGSGAIEAILDAGRGIHAVAHQRDRGLALVTLGLEDWLDLLAAARREADHMTPPGAAERSE